jgi:hypothetical protein
MAAYLPPSVTEVLDQHLPKPEDAEEGYDTIANNPLLVVRDAFFKHFGNKQASKNVALTMDTLRQDDKSANQYISMFDGRLSMINREDRLPEYMLIDIFIKGFNSSRLREQLILGPGGVQSENYVYCRENAKRLINMNALLYAAGKSRYEPDGGQPHTRGGHNCPVLRLIPSFFVM